MKSKFLEAVVAACCAVVAFAADQPAPLRLEPKRASWFSRVKVCRNLAYGLRQLGAGAAHADVAQTYDLYLPAPLGKIPKTAPFFLCIHGGAWMYGNKDGPLGFFEGFVKQGFVVASMNYALCNKGRGGDHTFADMLADIDAMVSHLPQLAAALGIDIDRIVLGGSSAGGHLALLYAYDGAKPSALGLNLAHAVPVACVFSDCGPTDLSSPEFGVAGMGATKSEFATWNGNFGALSGAGRDYGTFTNLVSHLARYSPVNLVCAESPPTICLYGDIGTVPTSNTFAPVPGGERRPFTELWKMVGSSATPPATVGTDGIVATQNYEALTNRLAEVGVPYAARIEKAGHCQILFRKPKTRPWLFENMKKYLKREAYANGRAPVAEIAMFRSPKSAVTNVVDMTPSAGGGWQCRIARETVDAFRLDRIEVTSPLTRARKGEAGYFVLGDGRYGTFRLDNGICGERPKNGFLPVAGMKTPRGAYRVTVRGLALESDFSMVATNGVYSLVTAFRLHGLAAKPGDHPYEDLVVEFRPMPKGGDAYADIARSYREEKLASGFVKPLSERVKGNRVLAYTAESIFVRVKHGWKALNTETEKKKYYEHQSPSNEPPIMVNIDFAQFKDIMRRMKEAGIDRAEVCSVGGTAGGFDGRFPDVLPIPEEFGGERGLKDAVAYGKSLGYQMTVHFATTAMLECSRRWNPDHLCLTPDGKPLARGIVAGGRTYRLCPQVYNSVYMAQDWKTFRDLGFLGTFHIDVISCIRPYACFNPLHPLNAAASAAHFRQVGDYSRKIFGAFGSEAGMDWMAPSLDFALYTSWYPGWGRRMESPLVDRLVPFWQLVYHGIVVSNPFYATIDAYIERKGRLYADNMITYNTFGDAETRILKLQEFGGRPVFYYTKYEDVAPLKRAFDDYRKRSHLQYCFMDDHRELAKDVFLTRYSNGEETVTNYGDKPFAYRGEDVPPRTFKLFSLCAPSVSR